MALNKPAAKKTPVTGTNGKALKQADCWLQLGLLDKTGKRHSLRSNHAGHSEDDKVVKAMLDKELQNRAAYAQYVVDCEKAGSVPATYQPYQFPFSVTVNIPNNEPLVLDL